MKPVRLSSDVPQKEFSQPYDVASKSLCRGNVVLKRSHQTGAAHLVGDVISVGKEHNTDPEVDPVMSPDHYNGVSYDFYFKIFFCFLVVIISFLLRHIVIFDLLHIIFILITFFQAPIVLETIPFSDGESRRITPNLSKKLPPKPQLHYSSKAGCSVASPVIVSNHVLLSFDCLSFFVLFLLNFIS